MAAFLIADTFTESLARLTGDEQKSVKTTPFDRQMDPSAPGLSFHKVERAKDKRFWSVRVSSDIRDRYDEFCECRATRLAKSLNQFLGLK
jgi:hypothetical protein